MPRSWPASADASAFRSSRSRRSGGTATGSRRRPSPIWRCARSKGCRSAFPGRHGRRVRCRAGDSSLRRGERAAPASVHGYMDPSAKTILVVDDDPDVRELSVLFLGEFGYNVVEAGDGEEGLALLREHPEIDLLFTDIVMPRL